ncbi:response regulator transcription factor [Parafrankia sp. FMc6]|uniref:response regulator transcription factor n=1 Tax=Parafrankia soli TaxID=2599596 RepID=UPI0034D4AEA5
MAHARVVVVEDEENVSYVVAMALRLADFEVIEVSTGRDALRLVGGDTSISLVVMDVMLPDLDGFEVCERMRAARVDVPVIFLSARGSLEDRVRGLTLGGDDYLPKPFSAEELVARTRAILRRRGVGAEPSLLTCGELSVHEDARRVTIGSRPIALSPTEYKLLRFLLRNAGRVVTRGQILDHVWDYGFDGESTVVETFISSLRRKVDTVPPRLIHTVRGVGYRLSEE